MKFSLFITLLFCGFSVVAQKNQQSYVRQLTPSLKPNPSGILMNQDSLKQKSQNIVPSITLKKKLTPDLSNQPSSAVRNINHQGITIKKSSNSNDTKTIHLSKNKLSSPEIPKDIKEN